MFKKLKIGKYFTQNDGLQYNINMISSTAPNSVHLESLIRNNKYAKDVMSFRVPNIKIC